MHCKWQSSRQTANQPMFPRVLCFKKKKIIISIIYMKYFANNEFIFEYFPLAEAAFSGVT